MKTLNKVSSVTLIVAGVFFLANITSDIQFGFGLVMTFGGIFALINL